MKKSFRFIRVLTVCLLVVAFLVTLSTVQGEEKEPYVVGAFCSVSGPNAPLGTPQRDTLLLLEEKINQNGGINGHPLKMVIYDDASDPTTAVKVVKQLIEKDNVCAIIGGSGTGPTMAVIPIVEEHKIPQIAMAAGIAITQPVKEWVFRVAPTDVLVGSKLLDYLAKNKMLKVAVIYDSNAFGTSGRDQLKAFAPKYGVKIVAEEAFNTKDTDMTVQLTKIRMAKAQAIICWGTNPAPAQVAKNVKQLGITTPLFMSHGVANQTFLDQSGVAANGIVLPAVKLIVAGQLPDKDLQKKVLVDYARDFEAKFNRTADHFGGHAWDALQLLIKAMEKAGDDRTKIREELEKTKGFVGIAGTFSYSPEDHDGLTPETSCGMLKIVKGKWTLLTK